MVLIEAHINYKTSPYAMNIAGQTSNFVLSFFPNLIMSVKMNLYEFRSTNLFLNITECLVDQYNKYEVKEISKNVKKSDFFKLENFFVKKNYFNKVKRTNTVKRKHW
jgi:hypothetical protein